MDVGRYEWLLEPNRRLHELLQERNYRCGPTLNTTPGHNYPACAMTLVHGLEVAFGHHELVAGDLRLPRGPRTIVPRRRETGRQPIGLTSTRFCLVFTGDAPALRCCHNQHIAALAAACTLVDGRSAKPDHRPQQRQLGLSRPVRADQPTVGGVARRATMIQGEPQQRKTASC